MKKDRAITFSTFNRSNKHLSKKLSFFDKDNYNIDDAIQYIEEISIILRKILDDKGGIFNQLDYCDYYIFPNYQSGMGSNLVKETKLVSQLYKKTSTGFISGYKSNEEIKAEWFSSLNYWWNEIVINDKEDVLVTRRDIVKTIADKEGGAHYDPNYSYEYYKTCIKNNEDIKSEMIVYNNLYFCSLLTIAKEYLYAINLLNKIQRSELKIEFKENNISLLLRKYPNVNNRSKFQFNIFDNSNDFASIISSILEKRNKCNYYINDSYIQEYIDGFTKQIYQIRIFKPNQINNTLFYISDVNKCIVAAGKKIDNNKFLLFNSSSVEKSKTEIKGDLISMGIISEEDYCYRILSNIEFDNEEDALNFIVGKYKGKIKWGDILNYDPEKSIVMVDKINKTMNSLSPIIIKLYEDVYAICKKKAYAFHFVITKFENENNFLFNSNLDNNNKIVHITINEEKVSDVLISAALLYAKLQLNGIPNISIKESCERIYDFFAGEIDMLLHNIIIRQIQDNELLIDRTNDVKEYAISISNNSVDVEEKIESKYYAIFRVLEYINKTRNYEDYYEEIEKYKNIFQVANDIFKNICEEKLNDPLYYREIMIRVFDIFKTMLINDGVTEIDFKENIAISYPFVSQDLEKKVTDVFNCQIEENFLTMYDKKNNHVAYYIDCLNPEGFKILTIKEFYEKLNNFYNQGGGVDS